LLILCYAYCFYKSYLKASSCACQVFSSVFDLDTSALVGSTAGALSVEQGSANYAIPIIVPPGISGMKPELFKIKNTTKNLTRK
jgi:hypothetical protein